MEKGIWDAIREQLEAQGVDLDALAGKGVADCAALKVVCVGAKLQESVEELGKTARDQVVMVRVDAETNTALDRWVETGAVKSRSEAAALFIREGLKVRATELEQLAESLQDVEEARDRLKKRVRELFGGEREGDKDDRSSRARR